MSVSDQVRKLEEAGCYPLNLAYSHSSTAKLVSIFHKLGVKAVPGPDLDGATLNILFLPVWVHAIIYLKKATNLGTVLVRVEGQTNDPDAYKVHTGERRDGDVEVPRVDFGSAEEISAAAKSPEIQALLVAEAAMRSKSPMFVEWAEKYAKKRAASSPDEG